MTNAIYNPKNIPENELPVIYGFNNGGNEFGWSGELIAQDGTFLGGHFCSSEGWMRNDLGINAGARPDRHEGFQKHYPDGYRMDFVSYGDVQGHSGLQAAFERNKALSQSEEGGTPDTALAQSSERA